jgi:hypothetical protein
VRRWQSFRLETVAVVSLISMAATAGGGMA